MSGKALLNDLGSSTYTSFDWAEKPSRDNVGFFFTRAPECFKPNSHPTRDSDVWSFGALAYRMFTGKYPLEEELRNRMNPAQMTEEEIDGILKIKLKKEFPYSNRRIGNFIEKCLSARSFYRPSSSELVGLLHIAANPSTAREVFEAFKKFGTKTAVTTLIGGAAVGLALVAITGSQLERPKPKVQGLLYLDTAPREGEQLIFEAENIRDLPKTAGGMFIDGTTPYAKASSENRNVAYLVDCRAKAKLAGAELISKASRDYMEKTFNAYASENIKEQDKGNPYIQDAVCINQAINVLKQEKGNMDLEDVLVTSMLGKDLLDEAKIISNSEDFIRYTKAQRSDGSYVIPEEDALFVRDWLAYIHDNH